MSIPQKLNYIADELEKWTTCHSEQLLSWRDGFYCNFPDQFCLDWLEVIEWLRWYKPDLATSLDANMKDVRIKFQDDKNGCKGRQDFLTTHYFLARISGSLLVGRLRRLSQIAKDDLESLADSSEVKSEAGTEQEASDSAGDTTATGQKEIVEVKPGAFGITVNIKEIAKRIWKRRVN